MWSAAPPPVSSSAPRRKGPKTGPASAPSPSSPAALASPTAASLHHPSTIVDLLEPAIDGPPSPESLRALSKQMKRASFLEKHQSQQTTSSGSSSLHSLASADRRSWEQAMDEADLSRKSSGRSTTSSVQRRDRPDSVQLFGKTIFGRRGRIKRDSGAQSSSGSSMYSSEMSVETGLPSAPPSRDTFIPAFFNRRRTPKSEHDAEESAARRKFQISGPYNFQHLTHTQRDQVPDLQRSSRTALQSEFSAIRASQLPSDGTLRGIQADDLHFADFSSEALPLTDGASALHEPHTRISLSRPVVLRTRSSPRRLQHSRSQETLGTPPPRPPRSPVEPAFVAPPVPPPRISSRISMRYDNFDPLESTTLVRPQTSGGFRHPAPLALAGGDSGSPTRGHSYSRSAGLDVSADPRYLHLPPTAPDDSNWPLPCPSTSPFDKALPDVPEEEEHAARKSRVSIVSNNSSLRGSQSVPLLRQVAQAHSHLPPRPLSGGSDTLGRVEMLNAQKALRAALLEKDGPDTLPRESWEDDIDYCYDHAAEANCEYAWDRPSLDLDREIDDDDDEGTPVEMGFTRSPRTAGVSPSMLTAAQFDMPALSPASQVSTTSAHEAVTPTAAAMPRSNFSLPRMDGRHSRQQLLHVRTASHASSFKESHGFTLSPSLLIPGSDYHHHMMAHEADADDLSPGEAFPSYDEPTLTMDPAAMFPRTRTSASTTGSNGSERTSSERHISTTSASTDMTRLTMDADDITPKTEAASASASAAPEAELSHVRGKSEPMAVLFEEPPESPVLYRNFSRNSEPRLLRKTRDDGAAKSPKQKEPKEASFFRRQRSKTTGGTATGAPVVSLPVANSLFWG